MDTAEKTPVNEATIRRLIEHAVQTERLRIVGIVLSYYADAQMKKQDHAGLLDQLATEIEHS